MLTAYWQEHGGFMDRYPEFRKKCRVTNHGKICLGKAADYLRDQGIEQVNLYLGRIDIGGHIHSCVGLTDTAMHLPDTRTSEHKPRIHQKSIYIGKRLRQGAGLTEGSEAVLSIFHTSGYIWNIGELGRFCKAYDELDFSGIDI
jgi:hypothetical protein